MFSGAHLSDNNLIGELHERMILSRIGAPAFVQHIDSF